MMPSTLTGEYVALLDHDDLLANDALYWVAKAIRTSFANLIYSDEDKVDENGRRSCPHFKPAFNIDLLVITTFHILGFTENTSGDWRLSRRP